MRNALSEAPFCVGKRRFSIFRFSACLVARLLATLILLASVDVSQNTDVVARRPATKKGLAITRKKAPRIM